MFRCGVTCPGQKISVSAIPGSRIPGQAEVSGGVKAGNGRRVECGRQVTVAEWSVEGR